MTAQTTCNAEGCKRSAATGHVLYRVAPKGEIGPWACAQHIKGETEAWSRD